MTEASPRLETTFRVAAGELGMCSAAWLFLRELGGEDEAAVEALRDGLGRTYPVLDTVARRWLQGARGPSLSAEAVVSVCEGATQLLVTGVEATFLDALVELVDVPRIGLLKQGLFEADWDRVLSNYSGRVEGVELSRFQTWAGRRSVLLAFAYGTRELVTHVSPSSLRALGPDVLTQFRNVVAWDVLGEPMQVYPRWVAEVPVTSFSDVA